MNLNQSLVTSAANNAVARLGAECFSAPVHDSRFTSLGDDLRDLVCARLSAMRTIATARTVRDGILLAMGPHDGARGWGKGTVKNLWYKFWASGGDWAKLLDKAAAGVAWWETLDERGLPPKFIEHLGEKFCQHQRDKFRSVWSDLKGQYRKWKMENGKARSKYAIPGYDSCPEPRADTGLPDGWSYGNLKRVADRAAKDYSRKLIQIGSKAASALSLPIPKTREGVEPGQYYVFDDSWNDFKVLFRGRAVRLLSLHALDLASGCNVLRGYKPAVEDEQGVMQGLKEREMIYLLSALFAQEGIHPNGTVLVCEKGTATVRDREREILDRIFGDKIRVDDGPRGGGPGVAGLFNGPGGGNPRWKAPLESWFNLLRNRTANVLDFPGQTGATSIALGSQPEGLNQMAALDEAVARASAVLPRDKAELLRFNLLSHEEAVAALEAVTEVINTRDDHKLEGWKRNFVPAFRLATNLPWCPREMLLNEKLSEAQRQHISMTINSDPDNLIGTICLSPRQVFNAGRKKLRRFTPAQTAMLLAEVRGDEPSVENGLLAVNCPEVNEHESLRYGPVWRDCEGREEVMRNGEKYLVRVNPFMPDAAFLFNSDNGFVGVARAWSRVAHDDEAALQEAFKTQSKVISAWTKDARRLAAPITKRAAEIAANNADVINGVRTEKEDLKELVRTSLLKNAK